MYAIATELAVVPRGDTKEFGQGDAHVQSPARRRSRTVPADEMTSWVGESGCGKTS